MKRIRILRAILSCVGLATIGVVFGGAGGCDNPPDCPAKADIHPGGSCGSDDLQCNYDVSRTACDGTTSTVESSCLCQNGQWACPDEWTCEAGSDEDAGDETTSDAEDTTPSDAAGDAGETTADAPTDTATDDTHD